MPKSNSQQKSTPDARTKRGRNGEERAAFLRVGTGQKALRAVGGRFFKLWEIERRNDRPEHTAGGSQDKGTEKPQRRAAPSPQEEGGRGRGKGQTQAQRSHPLPPGKPARFLSEDFLRRLAEAVEGGGRRARGESAPSLWLPGQDTAKAPHTQRQLPAEPCPPLPGLN